MSAADWVAMEKFWQSEASSISSQEANAILSTLHADLNVRFAPDAVIEALKLKMRTKGANFKHSGVVIRDIDIESGTAFAGIIPGDSIMNFNGTTVTTSDQIKQLLTRLIPGSTVHLEVKRGIDGRMDRIEVELGCSQITVYPLSRVRSLRQAAKLPVHTTALYTPERALNELKQMRPILGGDVMDDRKQSQGLDTGLVVSKVIQGSGLQLAQVLVGDRIISCDGVMILQPNDVENVVKTKVVGDSMKMKVKKTYGETIDVNVDITAAGVSVEVIRSLRLIAGILPGTHAVKQ
jgi:S1-C subfamily serine protease